MSHKNKGQLFCMDPSAGKVHWTGEPGLGESAAIVVAGPVLIALTNGGELLYLEPSAKGPKFLARHQAGKTPTWAHPLVSGNRLWIKDRTTLAAFALE